MSNKTAYGLIFMSGLITIWLVFFHQDYRGILYFFLITASMTQNRPLTYRLGSGVLAVISLGLIGCSFF